MRCPHVNSIAIHCKPEFSEKLTIVPTVVPARLRGASVGELASGASGLAREAADREIRGLGRGPESSRRLPGPGGGIRSRDRYLRNAVEEPESTSGGHSIRRLASANDGNLIVFEMAESPCRDDLRRGSAICRSPQASVGLPTAKPETGRNRAGLDRGLGTSRSPPKSRRAPAQRSLSDWSPRERQSRRRGTSTKGSRWSPVALLGSTAMNDPTREQQIASCDLLLEILLGLLASKYLRG